MAELGTTEIDAAQHNAPLPTARQQLSAIAWMRWRMYANGFRRFNERAIVARIFSYLLIALVVGSLMVLPIAGVGFAAYFAISENHPHVLYLLLWGVFFAWHFFTLNSFVAVAQQFDETTLIRFPLTLPRFLTFKLAASLLTVGMILASGLFLAVAIGIGFAEPALFPAACCSMALFLAFNILLSRALQTWINRWLSTRRAREIFAVASGLFFVGIQFFRLRVVQQETKLIAVHAHGLFSFLFTGPYHAVFAVLPPSLAAEAVLSHGRGMQFSAFAGLVLFLLIALATYVWRVRRQFYGEFLSDSPGPAKKEKPSSTPRAAAIPARASGTASPLMACLQKEWAVQRRNSALLMQTLMPLAFVVIFSSQGQMLARRSGYGLAGSIGYVMLSSLSAGYNLFGMEGAGIQFYLLAPVRIRDAVAAKQILVAALACAQAAIAAAVVLLMTHAPASLPTIAATLFWTVFVVLVNLAFGMFRSLSSPVKLDPNKVSLSRRNASGSRAGGYLALGMFLGSLLLFYPVVALCRYLGHPWGPVLIFALLAAGAAGIYTRSLSRVDAAFLARRENLVEVLTKAGV
jgi:ABC-2 type transport system permease protein